MKAVVYPIELGSALVRTAELSLSSIESFIKASVKFVLNGCVRQIGEAQLPFERRNML